MDDNTRSALLQHLFGLVSVAQMVGELLTSG